MASTSRNIEAEEETDILFSSDDELIMTDTSDEEEYHPIPIGLRSLAHVHRVDSSGEESPVEVDFPTIHAVRGRRTRGRPQKRRGRPSSRGSSSTSPSQSPGPSPSAAPGHVDVVTLQPPSEWSDDPAIEYAIPPFLSTSSINIFKNSSDCPTACEVFEKFFCEDFWQIVKKGTNLYAQQKKRNSVYSKYSMLQKWKAVTVKELKIYFTILFRTGLVKKPELECYWQRDEIYAETFSPARMTRDRFRAITSMLHLGDNTTYMPYGEDGHDPLYKLRPFILFLQDKFRSLYTPQQNISLDEATCPFKGRLKFKVYNKDKPHKWGIKLFELCESNSGYCFEFKVFCGIEKEQTKGKTHQLVMEMMERYQNKNHHLFMDRYYSSPTLYSDLTLRGTLSTGTCMANRKGLPKAFLSQKIKRGQVISCRKGSLMALKWSDKKEVLMLSTAYNNRVSTVNVRGPFGLHAKEKPKVVQHYNSNMGGVDLSDQLLSYYSFSRKTLKWWRKLFFHLINLGIINSSIVYNKIRREHGKPPMPLLKFMNETVKNLASGEEAPVPQTTADRLSARQFGHFPQRIPGTDLTPSLEDHARCAPILRVMLLQAKAESDKKWREKTPCIGAENAKFHFVWTNASFVTIHTKIIKQCNRIIL